MSIFHLILKGKMCWSDLKAAVCWLENQPMSSVVVSLHLCTTLSTHSIQCGTNWTRVSRGRSAVSPTQLSFFTARRVHTQTLRVCRWLHLMNTWRFRCCSIFVSTTDFWVFFRFWRLFVVKLSRQDALDFHSIDERDVLTSSSISRLGPETFPIYYFAEQCRETWIIEADARNMFGIHGGLLLDSCRCARHLDLSKWRWLLGTCVFRSRWGQRRMPHGLVLATLSSSSLK